MDLDEALAIAYTLSLRSLPITLSPIQETAVLLRAEVIRLRSLLPGRIDESQIEGW